MLMHFDLIHCSRLDLNDVMSVNAGFAGFTPGLTSATAHDAPTDPCIWYGYVYLAARVVFDVLSATQLQTC
jgi:hypothetical protein